MKKGTKIGWLLVAVSLVMSIWVIAGQTADANKTIGGVYEVSDDETVLVKYLGTGGTVDDIPATVTSIDAGAFANNTQITSVILPNTVTSIGVGAFRGCSNLMDITMSSALGSIPEAAFYGCTSLSGVAIPDSVTSIGNQAFYGCHSMDSITIPGGVTSVSTTAFDECVNLTDISVSPSSVSYTSADGCLYNAAGSKLLLVPIGKDSISMAAGTTIIGSNAFKGCEYIDTLSVTSGVKTIENNAFSNSGITTITVPASVTTFGEQSGWSPSVIYGYADTAAEKYAKDHNITFLVVGTSGSTEETDTPGDPSDPETPGVPEDPADPSKPGTSTDPSSPSDSTGATTTEGTPAGTTTSTTAGGAHVKDATPTTADGLDPRFFLCFGVFAGGVGVILYSKFNKYKYVSEKKNR